MRTKNIASALSLVTAGAGSPIVLTGSDYPFEPGNSVVIVLHSANLGGDAVLDIQGREDAVSAFAQLNDVDGNPVRLNAIGTKYFNVVLPQEIRTNITETTGAGQADADMLQN